MNRSVPNLNFRPGPPPLARVRAGAWIRALRSGVPADRPGPDLAETGGALGPALVVVVLPLPRREPRDGPLAS